MACQKCDNNGAFFDDDNDIDVFLLEKLKKIIEKHIYTRGLQTTAQNLHQDDITVYGRIGAGKFEYLSDQSK